MKRYVIKKGKRFYNGHSKTGYGRLENAAILSREIGLSVVEDGEELVEVDVQIKLKK